MFIDEENFKFRYAPILSLRPSEMRALQELTDKAKNFILPIILLRGWVGSKKLANSVPRIEKAFDGREWIIDIDESFLEGKKNFSGKYPREVFYEIANLLLSSEGYDNWYKFVKSIPKAIPTIQLQDLSQLSSQIDKLSSLNRGLVVKFDTTNINQSLAILGAIKQKDINNLFIIFDYGQVDRDVLTRAARVAEDVKNTHRIIPDALIAISCSSFPAGFSPYNNGENSIYERMLFNTVQRECSNIRMIYSDRGSARHERLSGGGIPSPRIDYPLKNQWRFIRKDVANPKDDEERKMLYAEAAHDLMKAEYWMGELHLWGTQMIELTSKAEGVGIDTPTKATAVRINLHMHQQVYYDDTNDALLDTEEDWVD